MITNIPSGLIFPSTVNCGLKKPSLSHQAYQEDSTAAGLYFSKAPSSRLCSTAHVSLYSEWPSDLFYAPGQWCHGMSYPWPRHLFSSWLSLILPPGQHQQLSTTQSKIPLQRQTFLASNFAVFAAFFASFSTYNISQRRKRMVHSFCVLTFPPAGGPPLASTCCPGS